MILFCPGNVPSSKNSRRWTGRKFIPSKATERWRKETKQWWQKNKERFIEQTKDKNKPLRIGLHFVRNSRHRYDWVNPTQTIQDEMVKHEWIKDDNVHEMVPVPFKINKRYTTHDKLKPGVYIKIY